MVKNFKIGILVPPYESKLYRGRTDPSQYRNFIGKFEIALSEHLYHITNISNFEIDIVISEDPRNSSTLELIIKPNVSKKNKKNQLSTYDLIILPGSALYAPYLEGLSYYLNRGGKVIAFDPSLTLKLDGEKIIPYTKKD